MTKKKEIERLIARYRADIAALEEREEHFMRRIEILQNILPTVLVWYMWKVSQSSRERPFLQHETEERARSKLEHLQSMLLELQQADQLLKEEEDLMRHRIDELEKSLTFPRNSSRMIHSETTGILDAQKDKVDKLDYHNLASNVLQPAKDIDWKTVSEDLTKEAGELRDKLNNSLQKLQQSEDNANNLEKKSLTLVKELEGNVKLLETQKGKPTPTLKVVENEETTFQDKYDGKSLSSLQEDPAFEKQMRQSESKSLTHNEDNSMGPLAEVSHVQDLTSLLSNSSKEGKTHEMDNQPLKTPASIFNEPVSVELKVKDMSLNNLSTTMEPQQSPKESSVLDKLSISSTAKPQSPNTWPSTDGNKPSNGTVIGSLVSKNSISNKSEPEMPMLVSPAVVEGSSVSKVVMDTAEDHFPDALAITSENILVSGKNEISKLEQKVSTHLESLHPAEESVLKLDVIRRINSEDVPQLTLVTDPHSKSSTSPEIQEATSKIDVVKQPTLNISRETLSETSQIADIEVGIDKRKSVSGTEGEILSSFTKESVSSPTENKLPHPEKPPISGVSHDVTRSVSKEFPSRDESSLAELEDSPDINPTSHVLSNTKFPVISPSRKNIKDTISESASDQAHVSKVWNASENPNTSNDLVASPDRALSSFDPLILNKTPSQQEATQSFHDVSQTPPEPVTGMSKDSMPSPSQETVKTTRVAANDNFMVRKPSITPANLPNLVESQNDDVVISPNPSDSEEVMSGLNIKKLSISETPITKVFKEVSKEKVLPKSSSNLKQISFGLDKGVTEGGREALLSETGVSKEVLPKEKANILVNEMQQSSSNRSGESEKKPKVDLILTKHKITDKVEPIESHLVGSTTSGNGKSPVFPVIQATKTVSEQSLVPGNDGILPETSEDKSQFKESIDHPTTEAEKTSLNLSGSSTLPMQTKIIQECPNKELSKEEFSSSPLLVPASHSKNLLSPFQDTSHFKGMDLDKVDVEPKVTIKPLESIQFVPLKSAADRTEGQAIVSEPMEAASTGSKTTLHDSSCLLQVPYHVGEPNVTSLAMQTLQGKMRVKDHLIKSLADHLRELARNNVWSGSAALEAAATTDPTTSYDFDRNTLLLYVKGKEPESYVPSMETNEDPNSNPLKVGIVRRLDNDSLLIKWERPLSAETVGFQIFLNGQFMYWVHSAKRNLALLHPLDLRWRLEINVSAIDASGGTISRSIFLYKPE